MNDCANGEMRDRLPDYLHERLDVASRAEVGAHLSACADCRSELALLSDIRDAIARAPAIDVGAIVASVPPYRAASRRSWSGWRAAAAVALLAVVGSSIALLGREHADSVGVPQIVASAPLFDGPPDSSGALVRAAQPLGSDGVVPALPAPSSAAARGARPRELAIAGGTVSELSEKEIAMLVDDLESFDVVPSASLDPVTTSPVAPDEEAS